MKNIIVAVILTFLSNDVDLNLEKRKSTGYHLSQAFPALRFEMPVELISSYDNSNRIFVVEQKGRIMSFQNQADITKAAVFLDIVKKVDSGGEKGLLGLAFHPDFENTGYFYVNYTRSNPLETVISRFKVDRPNAALANAATEEILLRFSQPFSNHNGGKIAFGKDGYLYISVGDGGSGGDPQNNGQDLKSLLGKILRIDVNTSSGKKKYIIPADNPFRGNDKGYREEIFAYGMRNAWRFNFDEETGWLWAGDVGQNAIEEIDIIEKGGNYGWRIMEGENCFKPRDCRRENLILPIWSYRQGGSTGRSVTGGFVCRDRDLADLYGKYIYGDFVSGNIWALTFSGKKAVKNELITNLSDGLSSFGEDAGKNLYVLGYSTGKVYKLTVGKN
ncbi:MAG TPA: PQQ-dependent sugar dehydrogenase [Chryseolinea sp.]|nr:PQQ-dependent sugar dehydrogenase [Chryseolinea sp.]